MILKEKVLFLLSFRLYYLMEGQPWCSSWHQEQKKKTLRTEPEWQITYPPWCCYFMPQRFHICRKEQHQLSTKCPSIWAHWVTLHSKQKLSPYQVFSVIQSIFYIYKMRFFLMYFYSFSNREHWRITCTFSKVLSLSLFCSHNTNLLKNAAKL